MFEQMWTRHEGYEMFESTWAQGVGANGGIHSSWGKLRDVSLDIKKWSFEVFGSVRAELKSLKSKLEDARVAARLSGSSQEVRQLEQRLHEIYDREEVMYRQRSRVD